MKFARNRHLRVRPQNQRPERILRVHHVEEREARVGPRRRQNLEERLVPCCRWDCRRPSPSCSRRESRASAPAESRLVIRLRNRTRRRAAFAFPSGRSAPRPSQRVERPGLRRESVDAVPAPGLDVNVLGIALAHGRGAIVGLQNVAEIVIVDREEARVGGVIAVPPILRVSRISEADAVPAPAVGLKDAARGRCRDEGEVPIPGCVQE